MKVYYKVSHFDKDSQDWMENNIKNDFEKKWPLYKHEFIISNKPRVEINQRNNVICDSKVRLTRIRANRFLKKSIHIK